MTKKIIELFGNIKNRLKQVKQSTNNSGYTHNDFEWTFNYEGAIAHKDDLYTRTLKTLTTGTFESTFYVSAGELTREAIVVLTEMRDKDPQFLAKAIRYARNCGLMRTLPITALVILSNGNNEAKQLTKAIFNDVIKTPGDLQDFVAICRSGSIRGMGRLIKSLVNQWLQNMSEIHAIKYGSDNQSFALRDIYRLTRPKLTGQANEIAKYIVKKEESPICKYVEEMFPKENKNFLQKLIPFMSDETDIVNHVNSHEMVKYSGLNQIIGYEIFKRTKNVKLIEQYNLPFEVVTSQVSTKETWKAMYLSKKLPFMFMLRNLNNLDKHGLLANSDIMCRIYDKLTDPDTIAYSKQFPFRFYQALKNLDKPNKQIMNALKQALELSVNNVPDIKGKTLIAVDFSGSMNYYNSKHSNLKCTEIANLFASSLYKKCPEVKIVGFHGKVVKIKNFSKDRSVYELINMLNKQYTGGYTAMSEPLKYALNKEMYFNNIIYVTDNISWYDDKTCVSYLHQYKRQVNANVKTIVIDILPYTTSSLSRQEDSVYQVSGWSNTLLSLIAMLTNDPGNQVDDIKKQKVIQSPELLTSGNRIELRGDAGDTSIGTVSLQH